MLLLILAQYANLELNIVKIMLNRNTDIILSYDSKLSINNKPKNIIFEKNKMMKIYHVLQSTI